MRPEAFLKSTLIVGEEFHKSSYVFQTFADQKEFACLLAQLFQQSARANREELEELGELTEIKLGVSGEEGVGKTPFTDNIVHAFNDFTIFCEGGYHQFLGHSPEIGVIRRLDLHPNVDNTLYLTNEDLAETLDDLLEKTSFRVSINEHFQYARDAQNIAIFMNQTSHLTSQKRAMTIFCQKAIFETQSYQAFLQGAQKFRPQ